MHARKRREELLGDRDADLVDEETEAMPQVSESAGDHAGASIRKLDLERAMAVLSDPERAAIVQCYHNDLSHEEAAFVLGCPVGTVKTHVLRAKQKLKTVLAAWGPESIGDHS
jgi:RNA polymerase sigma-70 factor (ECF subfamily)